jgi:dCTP deaminase
MILTGRKIREGVEDGDISISPFDSTLINPNSYNYRLDKNILVAKPGVIDPRLPLAFERREIGESGFLLEPNNLYLANTYEDIGSRRYTTTLIGRSSLGRLGLFLQITADLGHIGTGHKWTLELHVVQPLIVYFRMRIGQVAFWENIGEVEPYDGDYKRFSLPQPSKIYQENP